MEAFEAPRPGHSTPARVVAFDGNRAAKWSTNWQPKSPWRSGCSPAAIANGRSDDAHAGKRFRTRGRVLACRRHSKRAREISGISYCVDPAVDSEQRYNIVNVALAPNDSRPLERLERHFTMNSACGVCGKASIEALQTRARRIEDPVRVDLPLIGELPRKMREAQRVFTSTGGLHAAALFDRSGAAARTARRRGPPQCAGQNRRVGAARATAAAAWMRAAAQRTRKLRIDSKERRRRNSHRLRGFGAEQPCGESGERIRRDPRRLRARAPCKRVRRRARDRIAFSESP